MVIPVLEAQTFAAIQMADVHLPTTEDRTLILSRHSEPGSGGVGQRPTAEAAESGFR